MKRYLISFNVGDLAVDAQDLPAVAEAARAVVREARAAGVLLFAGGLADPAEATLVATDGTQAGAPPWRREFIAGLTLIEVARHDEALAWAGRLAAACRCAQELREIMPDSAL